jgi:hypothetical protein
MLISIKIIKLINFCDITFLCFKFGKYAARSLRYLVNVCKFWDKREIVKMLISIKIIKLISN